MKSEFDWRGHGESHQGGVRYMYMRCATHEGFALVDQIRMLTIKSTALVQLATPHNKSS